MESRICPMKYDVKANAQFLQQLIVGFGFRPTVEEMINYVKSEESRLRESFCIIPMLQDICKISPWDLPDEFNEKSIIPSNGQDCWFICPHTQSKRNSKKTPCGCSWKITGDPKDVKAGNDGKKIGSKKVLVFPSDGPTTWVIHEYHFFASDLSRDYVLCHVMHRGDEKDLRSCRHQTEALTYEGLPLVELRDDPHLLDDGQSAMGCTFDNSVLGDYTDASEFPGDQMQTQYGQTSNLHRLTQTMDSPHHGLPLEVQNGIVESEFSGSLVTPEKAVAPPVGDGTDGVLRFKKVKQEAAPKWNGKYVPCHVMRRRDEEADNSTIESEYGANSPADLELHRPDYEESSSELLQFAGQSQNSLPTNINQFMNTESPSFRDFSLENRLHPESGVSSELLSGESEEDEDFVDMLNEALFGKVGDVEVPSGDSFNDYFFDAGRMQTGNKIQARMDSLIENSESSVMDFTLDNLIDANFFQGDRMQTPENQRKRKIDSLRCAVPLKEKKGVVESKFSGSLDAPEKPMLPPARAAGVNYYGKDDVPRFEKVRLETAAKSIKQQCKFFGETAARAKGCQISIMENHQARMIGSHHGVFPLEQKKGVIQSKASSSHASSTKPMVSRIPQVS